MELTVTYKSNRTGVERSITSLFYSVEDAKYRIGRTFDAVVLDVAPAKHENIFSVESPDPLTDELRKYFEIPVYQSRSDSNVNRKFTGATLEELVANLHAYSDQYAFAGYATHIHQPRKLSDGTFEAFVSHYANCD